MIQAKDVMRVTGLSYRQIQYWDNKVVDVSRKGGEDSRNKYRSFSIPDVIMYDATAKLKGQGISLQSIRKSFATLLRNIIYKDEKFGPGSKIIRIGDALCHVRGSIKAYFYSDSKAPFECVTSYNECIDKLGLQGLK